MCVFFLWSQWKITRYNRFQSETEETFILQQTNLKRCINFSKNYFSFQVTQIITGSDLSTPFTSSIIQLTDPSINSTFQPLIHIYQYE